MSQAGDRRALNTQVRQVAVGQGVQFTHSLAIDHMAGAIFLHVLDRSHQTASDARGGSGVVGVGNRSHGGCPFQRLCSCVCARPGLALRSLDRPKMALTPHSHNRSFGDAAMQHLQGKD